MNKPLFYYTSMMVCGGGLVRIGWGWQTGFNKLLFFIGGIGVTLGSAYQWKSASDPSAQLPADWIVWVVTTMALISIGSMGMIVIGVG
jgi:hypothetical protein